VALIALARGWIFLRAGDCVAPTRSSLWLNRRYSSRSLPLLFAIVSVAVLIFSVNSEIAMIMYPWLRVEIPQPEIEWPAIVCRLSDAQQLPVA